MTIQFILILFAVICWGLAALGVPSARVNLGWLGLFLYGLSMLIRG